MVVSFGSGSSKYPCLRSRVGLFGNGLLVFLGSYKN